MIINWSKNLHDTRIQHIPRTPIVGICCWTCDSGCKPCGRCLVVALLPQIAKLPKKSQNFKICEVIWVTKLPLFWTRLRFVIWRWYKWRFKPKSNRNLINYCPSRPLRHSYYSFLHNKTSTFKIMIVSSHLYLANTYTVGFLKKTLNLQLRSLKLRLHFMGIFEGSWAWEVRG
jgi:hypothetical protein